MAVVLSLEVGRLLPPSLASAVRGVVRPTLLSALRGVVWAAACGRVLSDAMHMHSSSRPFAVLISSHLCTFPTILVPRVGGSAAVGTGIYGKIGARRGMHSTTSLHSSRLARLSLRAESIAPGA